MDLHRHLRSLALLIFVFSAIFSEAEVSQGCKTVSQNTSLFGCCPDGHTPAHGHNEEGCCINTPFGCCPDNILMAGGPALQGCECGNSKYGCCPNGVDYAKGPRKEGCGCKYTEFGCCPDGFTEATGPDYAGCSCETFQFGCCPDGETTAKGAANLGCGCKESEFGCCPDKATPAKGPDFKGCGCDASEFGCCPDGVEAAQGEKFEECADVPKFSGEACALPRDRGMCLNFTSQWFYDIEYGGCSKFWYGGCEGNNNRFNSEEECKNSCEAPPGQDACFLPKIPGPCVHNKKLWHYDTERKACTQFVYGGCYGNNNKFKTLKKCQLLCAHQELRDKCAQPQLEGPCDGKFERWFFGNEESGCKRFIFGGCKGNQNNFLSENACKQQCQSAETIKAINKCTLPSAKGPCRASILRWYFNTKAGECQVFSFGGCRGNKNNFQSCKECEKSCDPDGLARDVCSGAAPSDETCGGDQKLARWRFESESNRCLPFYTKGCDPNNRNSFIAEEHCLRRCPPKQEENICRLAPAAGECSQYVSRWFFNVEKQQCMQFYYGGCGGNSNNFEIEEDCWRQCKQQAEPEESHKAEYEAPQIQLPEPVVRVFEGGECTLKCHTRGNPQPTITWFKNQVMDGSRGRHRLLPEGSLQIIGLMKEDAGNYNCTAHNGVGSPAVRTIRVDVLDPPGRSDVEVVEVDPYVRVHLLKPAVLHCYAMGWPRPSVTWWRGDRILPMSSKHFEQRSDFTLLLAAVSVDDLGMYTCQAYNGVGKAHAWTVTVQAYRSPGGNYSQSAPYYQYLIEPPTPSVGVRQPYPPQPYNPPVQPVRVPVRASFNSPRTSYAIDTVMQLQCDVDGYPIPQVSWFKDAQPLEASQRVTISEGHSLRIERLEVGDAGTYECVARNQESRDSSSVQISVDSSRQQIHPYCTDSPLFANCKLMVLGRYCTHKYYERFCCRSCTEAGQLPLNGPHLQGYVPASSANN